MPLPAILFFVFCFGGIGVTIGITRQNKISEGHDLDYIERYFEEKRRMKYYNAGDLANISTALCLASAILLLVFVFTQN